MEDTVFNFLKQLFFRTHKHATDRRAHMAQTELDHLSRQGDLAIERLALATMLPSQRFEYRLACLRWRLLGTCAPQSRCDAIKAMGTEALAELREKYTAVL